MGLGNGRRAAVTLDGDFKACGDSAVGKSRVKAHAEVSRAALSLDAWELMCMTCLS